jgi:hypothetical protein
MAASTVASTAAFMEAFMEGATSMEAAVFTEVAGDAVNVWPDR